MYSSTTLIGNLGSDPELRFTESGIPVASFSIAVNRDWTDRNGVKQSKVTWYRCTCWRKLGETIAQYLTKGRLVMIVGEMEEARPWTDRDGNARASLEITAQTVKFLGGRDDNNGSAYQTTNTPRQAAPSAPPSGPAPAAPPTVPVPPTPAPVAQQAAAPATVNPIDTVESQSLADADIPF